MGVLSLGDDESSGLAYEHKLQPEKPGRNFKNPCHFCGWKIEPFTKRLTRRSLAYGNSVVNALVGHNLVKRDFPYHPRVTKVLSS